MPSDPQGQRSNTKVTKVTNIPYGSTIFRPETPCRVACCNTTQSRNVYLGMVACIGPFEMSLDPEGQWSNTKVTKVTSITCGCTVFTPGTPCRITDAYSTQARNV